MMSIRVRRKMLEFPRVDWGWFMKRSFAGALTLLMMSVPAPLYAKGATVKITIKGAGLATPIEITDRTVRGFSVYAGPGVFVNGIEETKGSSSNGRRALLQNVRTDFSVMKCCFMRAVISANGAAGRVTHFSPMSFYMTMILRWIRVTFTCLGMSAS